MFRRFSIFGGLETHFREKAGDFWLRLGKRLHFRPGGYALRVAIISRRPDVYATRRLADGVAAAGHEPLVIDQGDCALVVSENGPGVLHRGAPLPAVDVAIPRIGPTATDYGIALVRQLEALQTPVLNSAGAIAATKDRLRCLQVLASAGLPVPRTVLARESSGAQSTVDTAGGPPVVLKLPRSAKGIGVMLAESVTSARAILETFWALGEDLLIQERIEGALRQDTRIIVLQGEVVAAMQRTAMPEEFRANIHRGAEATPAAPSDEECRLALRATAALGLDLAGVDLVEGPKRPIVLEVNSTPGLEGVERATERDIASLIVAAAVKLRKRAS